VIEGTLAQPGQHFIESYLDDSDRLPGFRAGMRNVSLDEQRHIAFGVKMLSELLREDPDACRRSRRCSARSSAGPSPCFIPPDWDERYVTCFGFTLDDIYQEGAAAMEARLRAAGIEPEQLRIGLPFDISVAERVQRAVTLLKAGYLGPRTARSRPTPRRPSLLFDGVRRTVNAGVPQ